MAWAWRLGACQQFGLVCQAFWRQRSLRHRHAALTIGPSMAPVAAPPACPTRANTHTLWLHPHVFAMPVASHLAHRYTTRTHSSCFRRTRCCEELLACRSVIPNQRDPLFQLCVSRPTGATFRLYFSLCIGLNQYAHSPFCVLHRAATSRWLMWWKPWMSGPNTPMPCSLVVLSPFPLVLSE